MFCQFGFSNRHDIFLDDRTFITISAYDDASVGESPSSLLVPVGEPHSSLLVPVGESPPGLFMHN